MRWLALFAAGCCQAATPCEGFDEGVALTVVPAGIDEASGLALGTSVRPGFWTHNDGGGPIVGMSPEGELLVEVVIAGDPAVDLEDLGLGPGPDGTSHVFVADIGDNDANRSSVAVFRFPSRTWRRW